MNTGTLIWPRSTGTPQVVAAPGFAADCVETLEELALEGRDEFMEHGGEEYAVLDCLNTSDDGLAMIDAMLRRELGVAARVVHAGKVRVAAVLCNVVLFEQDVQQGVADYACAEQAMMAGEQHAIAAALHALAQ